MGNRAYKDLGFSSYNEYLNSDVWKNKREEYKSSNRPQRCEVCYSKPYELHHNTYKRLGNEALNDLIPLCRKCHSKVHSFIAQSNKEGLHGITLRSAVYKLKQMKQGKSPRIGYRRDERPPLNTVYW